MSATLLIALALQAADPAAPEPPAITVAEFLARADVLRGQGEAALTSAEGTAMRAILSRATNRYRAALAAETAAGRPASSCPPAPGQGTLTLGDVLQGMRAVPEPARATTPFDDAMARFLTGRYPCPAAN